MLVLQGEVSRPAGAKPTPFLLAATSAISAQNSWKRANSVAGSAGQLDASGSGQSTAGHPSASGTGGCANRSCSGGQGTTRSGACYTCTCCQGACGSRLESSSNISPLKRERAQGAAGEGLINTSPLKKSRQPTAEMSPLKKGSKPTPYESLPNNGKGKGGQNK